MYKNNINPSVSFFELYKNKIIDCRTALFFELDKAAPEFGDEARKILDIKLQSNNNPLMGELFPWIIKDLIDGDEVVTHDISVGWLAIYLYTLFLDEYVDNPKPLSSIKFITGSLLAKEGLLKISHFTSNTPYESLIADSLTHSALNQQLDVNHHNKTTNSDFKELYSEGKNYVVLACAGALASQNTKYADFIINFAKHMLLTLQYLDDIADFEVDYNSGNLTVLLNYAFEDQHKFLNSLESVKKKELLGELIKTGALQRVVNKIVTLLEQIISSMNQNNIDERKSSFKFINSLKSYCSELNNYLIVNQFVFGTKNSRNQSVVLDKVQSYIIIIAQSS